ncbi:MBL fold metallo-hydrolase [Microlunatus ginsengisoli]|uniref:MBL fold metallo-hydrolase n=1 Tax=Microlunatus ginsengisoli TaxID=363863 RepID=A0ABP7AQE3_9ACTN
MADRIIDDISLVRAANPGPMTLTGTNTYIVGAAEQRPVVVDPGPLDEAHLTAIVDACPRGAGTIVLTHWHHDHSEAAADLAARLGCPVRAVDERYRLGELGLADGDSIDAGSCTVDVIATPGHTADSVCLLVRTPGGAWLLTGDTVLGTGTSVIMHPDGHLGSYLDSIDRLTAVVAAEKVERLLPGHGPVVDDPAGWLAFYRQHRRERLEQVREALAAGDTTAAEVVARVYADVDRSVWPAAERSVAAQLQFLAETAS